MDRQNPQLRDFVQVPFALLSLTGVRLFKWDPAERPSTRFLLMLRIGFMTFIITFNFIHMFAFLLNGQLGSVFDITALTVYWGFALNALAKAFAVWLGRSELEFVFRQFADLYPKSAEGMRAYRIREYYAKIHRWNRALAVFHMVTTSMFNWFPLVQSLVEYYGHFSDHFEYRFPFIMLYLFDEKQPLGYAFAYVMQCLGSYNVSCFALGSDLLLTDVLHLLNMHFDYLTRQIAAFIPTGTDADQLTLARLLTYHANILRYCELVDSVFNVSILVSYFGYCLILCMIGLQVVAGTELLSLVKFMAFLVATMAHVYLISHMGNTLIDLSEGISEAFCYHAWYMGNVNYQRMMYMPVARAQRPAAVTACKFFNISMESFKTAITTSYQFFTLLRTRLYE